MDACCCKCVTVEVIEEQVTLDVSEPTSIGYDEADYVPMSTIPIYDGPYELVPTETVQTIATTGKSMAQNIVIDPIPSNYGRIEQRGSALYVY